MKKSLGGAGVLQTADRPNLAYQLRFLYCAMIGKSFPLLLAALTALPVASAAPAPGKQYIVYAGTFTGPQKAQGIYAFRFDDASGKLAKIGLAVEAQDPSYLLIHPNRKFLFTPNYGGHEVRSFAIDPSTGMLKLLSAVPAKGTGPCYVSLDRTNKWLFNANFGSGSVAVFPVHEDGTLGESSSWVQHSPAEGQKGRPRVHAAITSPDNKYLLATDIGMDKIMIYRFDAVKGTLTPNSPDSLILPAGSGPRHIIFHPNGKLVYLINESTAVVNVYSYDARKGSLTEVQAVPGASPNIKGKQWAGEIALHPNGRLLYISERNGGTVGIFAVDRKGMLTPAGHVSSGGRFPRHFAIDPTGSLMIVSNQEGDNLVVFRIDTKTGKLTPTGETAEVPTPIYVKFFPVP